MVRKPDPDSKILESGLDGWGDDPLCVASKVGVRCDTILGIVLGVAVSL